MASSGLTRQNRTIHKVGANHWRVQAVFTCLDSAVESYTAAWFDTQHIAMEAGLNTVLRCRNVQSVSRGFAPNRARVVATWESVRDHDKAIVVPDIQTYGRRALVDSSGNTMEGYDSSGGVWYVINRGQNEVREAVAWVTVQTAFREAGETDYKDHLDNCVALVNNYNSSALGEMGKQFAAKRLLLWDIKTAQSWHDAKQWDQDWIFCYSRNVDWDTMIRVVPYTKGTTDAGVVTMAPSGGDSETRNPYSSSSFSWLASKTWSF